MKNFKMATALCLVMTTTLFVHGQSTSEDMIKEWERAKAYTQEYLEAMPADKYDYRPTEGIRTFAQQMLHLTEANYGFAAAATGASSPFGQGDIEKTEDTSKENVSQKVLAGYDFVLEQLQGLQDETLSEKTTLFGRFEMTKAQAIQKAFEHQTHHRGQTTIYLRMAGVTPPQEKLF